VRYAIVRRRAERTAARLRRAELRQAENARLSRGLLPRLLLDGAGLLAATRYRPGGADAVLGGDFYDAVCLPDGTVRAVIGDVCGHGPDEAAIGVGLRIAWRALIRAGVDAGPVLAHLDELLGVEAAETTFATVCDIEIPPDRSTMTVRLAGHPPPLLLEPDVRWLEEVRPGPPLGVQLGSVVGGPPTTVPLPERWALVLVTDGLFEGRTAGGRLGMDGLARVAATFGWERDDPAGGLDELLAAVDEATDDDHADDVAVLYLAR
jgi:serine phosphatase RsbU (regulator of sigma subunit)